MKMRTFKLNKLVRDKIVDYTIGYGGVSRYKTLHGRELNEALIDKLIEEAQEFKSSKLAVEELADLKEIIEQLARNLKITQQELKTAQDKKIEQNGAFKKGHFVEQVSAPASSKWAKYYASDPIRFREINRDILKIYVAGKVQKESSFGTHYWRDGFVEQLEELSGLKLENLDPTKSAVQHDAPEEVFGYDAYLISQADIIVAYLSDDISVGGSQEILIAKYFEKPVIGLAPKGGKFNGATREHFGKKITDYKDPFVFTTCDVVCDDIRQVAAALKTFDKINPKKLKIIDDFAGSFKKN